MEEVIDLDDFDSGANKSVNFGGGLEFLMNDKKRSSSPKTQIDLAELDNLENELNDLAEETSGSGAYRAPSPIGRGGGGGGGGGGFFSFASEPAAAEEDDGPRLNLGGATADSMNTRTWDGFSKMNLDAGNAAPSASAGLSTIEKRRKKRAMLKKIDEWCEKGIIRQNPNFTMDTPFEEVEDEYEACLEDKKKKDSIKFYAWSFTTFVNTIEFLNSKYDPFDINLDGWGEQVSDDMESYEDIFAQLHEKYKGGKLAPELSLLLRLGFSAATVNFTNKALATATPGFNDIIRQNPDLMRGFINATVDTMSKQNPTMGYMSSMMGSPPGAGAPGTPAPAPSTAYGRPPPPVETQGPRAAAPPPRPGQMNYTPNMGRPDLAASRPMFQERGVEMNGAVRADMAEKTPRRPDMSGPSEAAAGGGEINDILANLKTKTVDIKKEDDSMVSISSLKDLQSSTTLPKSSRRRGGGGRGSRASEPENVVSLDI
jgi:hypothetical protein